MKNIIQLTDEYNSVLRRERQQKRLVVFVIQMTLATILFGVGIFLSDMFGTLVVIN